MAQPFDPDRLELRGTAMVIADDVDATVRTAGAAFSVSQTGVLAFQAATGEVRSQLAWFDRDGNEVSTVGEAGDYGALDLSADARQVGISSLDPVRRTRDLWIYDVDRGVSTRFTSDPDDESQMVWAPDGTRAVFNKRRAGVYDLYEKTAEGAGAEQLLFADGADKYPVSWSRDGQFLLYRVVNRASNNDDLWVLPLADRRPRPFAQSPFAEAVGRFSPDGRWVAYRSNESNRSEVYVGPFPGPGTRVRVSTDGGNYPVWSGDGSELFYLSTNNTLMAATVNAAGARFEVQTIRPLFPLRVRVSEGPPYAVSPDGRRFLVNTVRQEPGPTPVSLVINWPAFLVQP